MEKEVLDNLIRNNIEKTIEEEIPDKMFAQFMKLTFEKSFEKKRFLAEAGINCNYQYFILKGSCYSYYINERGDKNAIQFAIEIIGSLMHPVTLPISRQFSI